MPALPLESDCRTGVDVALNGASRSSAITLPVEMWSGLRFEINPVVAVVSSLLLGISVASLLAIGLLRRLAGGERGVSA